MSASEAEDDELNKLFGSDSEDDAAGQSGVPFTSAQAAQDLEDEEEPDVEVQEPAAPVRRMEDDKDEDEDEADALAEPEEQERLPERPVGPPLLLEAPLVDLPGRDNVRLVKMSNILGIQTTPFSAETFEKEEETYFDDMGVPRVKLKDQNTIRWRYAADSEGNVVRESNARFVRWSDGSLQLLLADDVLDVAELDISHDNQFLFVRHQGLIQGQAQLTKRMAFRPASLTSKFHRRLTSAVDKRHVKLDKVRATATIIDPKREKLERERAEEARIRDKEQLANRQEREMCKYSTAARTVRSGVGSAAGGLSTFFLEEDEDDRDMDEDDGLGASERARQALSRSRRINEQEEAEAERRLASAKRDAPPQTRPYSAKRRKQSVAEDDVDEEAPDEDATEMEGFIVNDDAESEDEDLMARKKPKGRHRGVVLSDDDED